MIYYHGGEEGKGTFTERAPWTGGKARSIPSFLQSVCEKREGKESVQGRRVKGIAVQFTFSDGLPSQKGERRAFKA